MKTIELMINGQKAQFTTKSVTLEGKEYFYSKITQLDHSPVVLTYRFEYDGEDKLIRYEKKDAQILAAIFSQVHKMIELKKAKAAQQPAEEPKAEAPKAEEPAKVEVQEEAKTEPVADTKESTKVTENAEISDEMSEMIKATVALNEERAKKEAEKAAKKARKKAIKEAKKNGTPLPEEENDISASEDTPPVDPVKQAKIKKSLKVFAIIIAAFIVCAGIYYFVFGTNNAPSDTNPGNTESQQYDDIDQLIEDLQ